MERKKFKIFEIIFLIPAKAEGVKFYNRCIEQCSGLLQIVWHSERDCTRGTKRRRMSDVNF